MGKILAEFAHLFERKSVATQLADAVEDEAQARLQRRSEIEDARVAVRTQFFKEYTSLLEFKISELRPDPLLGTDVAACLTFKRAGLEEAREMLNHMLRLAQEKLSDE